LGALHARWNPVPGRFKDYIAMPKFNMYQSLHTTVIGPTGKPVEIQIRSYDMHRRAEYGVAAHWKYKESARASGKGKEQDADSMHWLRQLLDWQRETADPGAFLDSLRYEMSGAQVYVFTPKRARVGLAAGGRAGTFRCSGAQRGAAAPREFLYSLRYEMSGAQVYVFTPKGDVMGLAAGATAVDFAYAVHTEVGHRTVGARVNGRLVPLDSTLENGDTVEVFTS